MSTFQDVLWGYELTYPDAWVHQHLPETEGFAASPEAFDLDSRAPGSGHILLRADWNGARQPVEQRWTEHIGRSAGLLMAKKVGAAPWHMGGGVGFEAEIVLPKRENRRLWVGMLSYGLVLLQLMVSHPAEDRAWFDPAATDIIRSLRFLRAVDSVTDNSSGIPLPPNYTPVDPATILPDIQPGARWEAYGGGSPPGALQAFYTREMLARGWGIDELVPFPGPTDLGFARLRFSRQADSVVIGVMPVGQHASVVVRYL